MIIDSIVQTTCIYSCIIQHQSLRHSFFQHSNYKLLMYRQVINTYITLLLYKQHIYTEIHKYIHVYLLKKLIEHFNL